MAEPVTKWYETFFHNEPLLLTDMEKLCQMCIRDSSETIQLVEHLKQTEPELVADAIPNVVSYANLEKILKSLLREGIPIKDLATILEAVVEASGGTRDIDMITEQVLSLIHISRQSSPCMSGGPMRHRPLA